LHLAAIIPVAVSLLLIMAPAAYHRQANAGWSRATSWTMPLVCSPGPCRL
jgi:hypothetical protein